jgi:hypothetical protein
MCRIAVRISGDWNRWPVICRESRHKYLEFLTDGFRSVVNG